MTFSQEMYRSMMNRRVIAAIAWVSGAEGFEADLIGVEGDPSVDIEALGRIVFVMRAGRLHRDDAVAGSSGR